MTGIENVGVFIRENFGSKLAWGNRKGATERGRVRVEKQFVEGKEAKWGPEYVREKPCSVEASKGSYGMVIIRLLCYSWICPFFKL